MAKKKADKSKNQKHSDINLDKEKNNEKSKWFSIFCLVVALTFATRFHNVTVPDHVCWDETHFGKMGSWYINRTFFFDVHPPLGKMLIGLSGYLTGYDGRYAFDKPGDKYNGTRFEGMRIFCTTLGALVIPMAFDTVHDMTRSSESALVAAAYLIFDVGLLTLNQYILLDPILLFFMMASVWGMVKISKTTQQNQSYTKLWWFWLFFTGTMLSCTISVKFVGLFVVLLVGTHTAIELWMILGDLDKPVVETIKQIHCRAVTLILWPILLYVTFFYIHLTVLNRSGNGDGFYSSAFQSRLIGNSLYNASMPRDVAYGAIVTIKNHKTGGGYLHSHYHLYPKGTGARQQQITTYTHKDDNNKWLIKHYNKDKFTKRVQLLKHGDLVRLQHVPTKRNLHSHPEPAPLTRKHLQVTGYGENGHGDANDIFRLLIVNGKANQTVKTVTTQFKFIHYLQNCALTTTGKQLPKWGFEQQEVTCNPNLRDKYAIWNFEDNKHDKLPNESFSVYAPRFIPRFLESHAVMFQGNAGLKPKEGEVTSRPWQWPINYRGQFFSGSSHRVYLLGNPIIWWSNLIFLALFLIVFFITAVKERRAAGRRARALRLEQEKQQQQQLIEQQLQQQLIEQQLQQQQQQQLEQLDDEGLRHHHHCECKCQVEQSMVTEHGQEQKQEQEQEQGHQHEHGHGHGHGHEHDEGELKLKLKKQKRTTIERETQLAANGATESLKPDPQNTNLNAAIWLFFGWALHYLPFWAMGRVLYFHHYFPALIFNSMLTGVMYGYLTGRLPRWLQHALFGTVLSILAYSFVLFSPLAYGMNGPMANEPNSTMHGLKWLSSWEF